MIYGAPLVLSIVPTQNGLLFFNDHTHICWVYLLKDKTKVRSIFINFHSMIQTQFKTKIQILYTNNGTKYFNNILGNYLHESRIIHQSSYVDIPQ